MQRYTLWQRCENAALILLEGIIRTGTDRLQEEITTNRPGKVAHANFS